MTARRTILHLCADTGSDSWPYQQDPAYDEIRVSSDIGVENYSPDRPIHGIIANPVCTEFSAARYGNTFGGGKREVADPESGMFLVRECMRVIEEADRKSTRLNSSHVAISYAVFCLKKKKALSRLL